MKKINSNISYTDNIYYVCRTILIIGLPLVIVSAFALSLPNSSAVTSGVSSDNLTLSLPSSCTLGSVINTAHNAILISGTYTQDIGKTTITTLCNDGNGYAIYANGFSNGVAGNNVLVSNISNGHNIETGVYTQGASDSNTSSWSMRLDNVVDDTSSTPPVIEEDYNSIYGLVPNTWTKVASRQSGTTDMITGSSFTTTYAVYTAPTQHAGTYTGQVAYALIHAYGDETPTILYMQDVAEWQDEISNSGDSIQAVDKRDGKTYWVTRLADGHIWMTQNLDFDIEANTILNSNTTDLNEYNTDPTEGPYYYGYSNSNNTIYWEPASTAATINFTGTAVTGWNNSNTTPASASKTDDTNIGHASLGNYYNWTAAIASNNSGNLTTSTYNDVSQNPKNSICPRGWRLPTISNEAASITDSTNEFARLNYLYNNNLTNTASGLLASPVFFVMAGEVTGTYTKSELRYISSTVKDQNNNYFLQYKPSDSVPLNLSASWTKSSGRSIRCLAR